MKTKLPLLFGMSLVVAGILAGCTATTPTPSAAPSAPVAKAPAATTVDAKTASISLGTVVVDGSGHTAYFFDKDTKGTTTSACTGGCAATWPAITSASKSPKVTGITGTVATIPANGGKFQITINGMPIYDFSGDSAAGDSNGQGVGGIWWAAGPDGTEVK
jgi:predicted lipoprotein with Yx(FWY)xxD motif